MILGFWIGFWTGVAWWTWVLSFYDKPLPPAIRQREGHNRFAGNVRLEGNGTRTQPHWDRSGP